MHVNSGHPYDIPIISSDLRKDECILQIADALEYLDKVANDVFSKISNKVSDNKKRLQNVNDRINLAHAKIEKIKGTSKATKIFSSPKYPAEDDIEKYESLFKEVGNGLNEIKRNHHQIRTKFVEVDENILREKLQYYNVSINKKTKNQEEAEGLGRLPNNINSVSSLLLFNSTENPYKKYVMFDPLGVVTKVRKEQEEEDDGLTAAPVSILQGEEMERRESKSLKYRPELGEVPDISLPDTLPELLGVADDMSFSADIGGSSIAPSVPSMLPDLPAISPEVDNIPSGPAGPGGGGPPAPPPAVAPPPPPPSAPPAAPPPPPPSAPAAPPPPIAPAPPAPSAPKEAPEAPKTEALPEDDGGRSGLLAAIRNAGGIGVLKGKKKQRKRKESPPPVAAGGGDLLSDLKNRLTGRRKGISGTKSASSGATADSGESSSTSGASGAIEAMKSFIPPPPARPAAQSNAGDDDDWE